ncbi:MAG: transglutaminase-like domain-containing protein [Thermosphaera sp.]
MIRHGKTSGSFQRSALLLLLILIISYAIFQPIILTADVQVPVDCEEFFFLNAIWISFSNITETLYLESPSNFTLGSTINQTVETLYTKNVVFNSTVSGFEFNVAKGEGAYAYLVNKVRICYPRPGWMETLIIKALSNVSYQPASWSDFPSEVVNKYVRPQNPAVVNIVVPQFEAWFQRTYGIPVANASAVGLAAAAAWFIYMEFIEYDASAEPRSIEQVVQSRRGDCDDMSRILVEILNYYGIPATIGYGYVYISDERFSRYVMPVENVTYIFRFNGPHAFTLAYIPGIEWVSVDWLAGSLWRYPFLFESESRETAVNESAVEQMLDLHRNINGSQLIAILSRDEFIDSFGLELNQESIEDFINRTISGEPLPPSPPVTENGSDTNTSTITSSEERSLSEQESRRTGSEIISTSTILLLLSITGVAVLTVAYFLRRKTVGYYTRGGLFKYITV